MPYTAYIVEAVRTAGGRKNGVLSKWHPSDLGALVVDEVVKRAKINPALVDDVIVGCVSQTGAQSGNIGRNVVLASKLLPETVPGVAVDRQCGSSQQALHFAAQAVMSGTQDVVIAAGVEVMSLVPIGASVMDGMAAGHGMPVSPAMAARWLPGGGMFSQFEGAELVAKKWNISRAELEKLAADSHRRAAEATEKGYFRREIVPVQGHDKDGNTITVDKDEGIRASTTVESLAKLKVLKPGGVITAGTSSQITDGAAAVLICNERGLQRLGLRPRARIVGLGLGGADPVVMLSGPIPATQNLLQKLNLKISDIGLYEVNEAFASVPLAWAHDVGADLNRLNVNGGAMALGHPLGASGCKLMTTLLHELERRKERYGLLTMCEGGGTANCTIIERCADSKL